MLRAGRPETWHFWNNCVLLSAVIWPHHISNPICYYSPEPTPGIVFLLFFRHEKVISTWAFAGCSPCGKHSSFRSSQLYTLMSFKSEIFTQFFLKAQRFCSQRFFPDYFFSKLPLLQSLCPFILFYFLYSAYYYLKLCYVFVCILCVCLLTRASVCECKSTVGLHHVSIFSI